MAKCEICGAFFVPRTANQVSCGDPKCRAEKKRRRRVKREGRVLLPMDPRPCAVCGKVYTPRQSNQVACGEYACMLEMRRRAAKARYAAKLAKGPHHACPICKKSMVPVNGKSATCQKKACIEAWAVLKKSELVAANNELQKRQRMEAAEAERQRLMASIQCPFAGPWTDDKGRVWPRMGTNIPGVTWDDPIMGAWDGWDSGGVWVETNERAMVRAA